MYWLSLQPTQFFLASLFTEPKVEFCHMYFISTFTIFCEVIMFLCLIYWKKNRCEREGKTKKQVNKLKTAVEWGQFFLFRLKLIPPLNHVLLRYIHMSEHFNSAIWCYFLDKLFDGFVSATVYRSLFHIPCVTYFRNHSKMQDWGFWLWQAEYGILMSFSQKQI